MRITADEIRNLPDGSKIKLFLSGDYWDEDYGKVINTIKVKDRLFVVDEFYGIEDLEIHDETDEYFAIEAAYNKKDQYFTSFKN